MTNRRLIKQQIDDYEKDYAQVFGEYSDQIDAYNARIEQAKGGDHVAIPHGRDYRGETYLITDSVSGGQLMASNPKPVRQGGIGSQAYVPVSENRINVGGARIDVPYYKVKSTGELVRGLSEGYSDSGWGWHAPPGVETTEWPVEYRSEVFGGKEYDVLRKPAEPDPVMPPRFTNKQLANYHNPQPTYADSAKADGESVTEKYTGIDEWRSGITTDKGILQRVLQGAYK